MRRLTSCSWSLIVLLVLTACNSAAARREQEARMVAERAAAEAAAAAAAQAASDPAQVMEAMARLAAVRPEHAFLEQLAGEWQAEVSLTMGDGPPQKGSGVSRNELIMGGRFLQQNYAGMHEQMEFQGLGLLGFDNAIEKYVGTWVDNMGTMILPVSTGSLDASGKVLVMRREMVDPMSGQPIVLRDITTILGPDRHKFEMYQAANDPRGDEKKLMEAVYTRVP